MKAELATSVAIERKRIVVLGIVQGVGFRPFVYGLASEAGLAGFVRNGSEGVTIEVEGGPAQLRLFLQALQDKAPPLARIDAVHVESLSRRAPRAHTAFTIVHSATGERRQVLVSPDVATCADCLRELEDPNDRRFGYPFTNCTNCGPRFTIIQDLPYDRDKTTMVRFAMCPACRQEYEDPLDRRFHAQPNACPACGPHVLLVSTVEEQTLTREAAVHGAARLLASGHIVAVKGLGGYHLACNALDEAAVQRLRQQKRREAKPFALMVPDLQAARRLCHVDEAEAALLRSRRRPIVLLARRSPGAVAPSVAGDYTTLGLMLPYTPLHTLLLEAYAAVGGKGQPAILVMTSGNFGDEPIAYEDGDARARLASVADAWLAHDRPIHTRCDDSVVRVAAGAKQFFRRSRGYAPEPIRVAQPFPVALLACGGHLKNTFCLGRGHEAFVSQHVGDLENLETLVAYRHSIVHLQRLFDVQPEAVAYDLHPDYLATRYADGVDVSHKIAVQHHHAHIASVLAEHGLDGPVIGVAADGAGYGSDGAVWGGELLIASLAQFERAGHLAYVPMPGSAQAIRQPWRMAAVHLQRAYGDEFLDLNIPFVAQLDREQWRTLRQMAARAFNSPPTSSLGRLFDAVAALLGVRETAAYEGQAAVELEMLAAGVSSAATSGPYPYTTGGDALLQLDVAPAIRAIVADMQRGQAAATIAHRFHQTVGHLLADACVHVGARRGLRQVALSGGVFQNRLLLEQLRSLLLEEGFDVYVNRQVPPNDGGLSLGQAAVASARLRAAL